MAVRDDPAARLVLLVRSYHGPTGRAPRHLPFRRAALSFTGWQVHRGLLNPLEGSPPGSVWWRSLNERLLRDGCESVALVGGLAGTPSSHAVRLWLEFTATPTGPIGTGLTTPASWAATWTTRACRRRERTRALLHERRAGARPLRARTGRGAALGARAPRSTGPPPRRSPAGDDGSLPLTPPRAPTPVSAQDVEPYILAEQRLGRLLDYAVVVPRLQRLYEWSAEELGEPRLLELVRDGSPIYAWPYEKRYVWRSPQMPFTGRVLRLVTRAR